MSVEFHAERDPTQELCRQVAALAPSNPFYTSSYIENRRMFDSWPWMLLVRDNGHLISGCTAFMKSGYFNRSLEIPSVPAHAESDGFWEGLFQFCHGAKVSHLTVNSFASTSARIPLLRGEIARTTRSEYVLELQKPGLWDALSSNHARNIKRARKAGLGVRRAVDDQTCHEHAHLVCASMGRRKSQGESVPEDIQAQSFVAMAQSGAGELFQAVLDGKVLSSVLVLMAEKGGYYQSAGTSREGMASGASHFVVYEIVNTLRAQGIQLFNLGGSDRHNPGLERFKSGFGATSVELEAAEFFLGSAVRKMLGSAARWLRDVAQLKTLQRKKHTTRVER